MAFRKIKWSPVASKQLRNILRYWLNNNRSPTYPNKILDLIESQTKKITKFPNLFPETSFTGIRISKAYNFSILYKVYDDYILIIAFWDNRQDPKELLSELKQFYNMDL